MGKSIRVEHKIKGESLAAFNVTDGVAEIAVYGCETFGVALSSGMYAFLSEMHPNERAEFSATIRKSGAKWSVAIRVRYVCGGVFQSLTWEAGEFSGTRGTALYRAFLAFGEESREGGTVRIQLETERAARYDTVQAIYADAAAERESTGEVCPSTGKTFPEMRDAVSTHYANGGEVPAEIATLPDPSVKGGEWSGHTGEGETGAVLVCEFKGDVDVINPERTDGKCPECAAYIPLMDVKSDPDAQRIGKHNVGGVSAPASKGLTSRSVDNVEHGSTPGDPASANKRRVSESECKKSRKIARGADGGTVACPDCTRPVELFKRVRKDRKTGEDVTSWYYPEHGRAGESFRAANGGKSGAFVRSERKVTPRGTGADAGKGARDHGHVNGSANTGAQNMAPVQPKSGWLAVAGTMSLPAMVRPGVDPVVAGKFCPVCNDLVEIAHLGKSRSWRRRHAETVKSWHKERNARREAVKAREIAQGKRLKPGERRALRQAASIGNRSSGTLATTGTVVHAVQGALDGFEAFDANPTN